MPQAKASLRGYRLLDHTRAASLFGIAPGGACRAGPVTRPAVRSYRTVSPLLKSKQKRFLLCGAIPQVPLAGRYPAPLLHGVRTFLDSIKNRSHPAFRTLVSPNLCQPMGQLRIAQQATPHRAGPQQFPPPDAKEQSASGTHSNTPQHQTQQRCSPAPVNYRLMAVLAPQRATQTAKRAPGSPLRKGAKSECAIT
jgi:hypothetical protein